MHKGVQSGLDRHFFLVADGHVYKRVDVPNSKPRRWHLVEMEWESALNLMIHDCERLAALSCSDFAS